ncbi:hypothetical protein [Albidovulum sediminis]
MTLFGQQAGANLRQLSLVHVTRLLVCSASTLPSTAIRRGDARRRD